MRSHHARPRRAAVATIAGCALLGATLTGAFAAPAVAETGEEDTLAFDLSTALVGAETSGGTAITLITGDTAYLTTAADGTQSVVLRTADEETVGDVFTRTVDGDIYSIPVDLLDAISDGTLDAELFNVTGLVRQGYDDASSATMPVIVRHAELETSAELGLTVGAELESIDADAVSVDKELASLAFESILAAGPDARIELDALMYAAVLPAAATVDGVSLDPATGVEQTGAPDAWAAGYTGAGTTVAILDSGWDSSHPDLVDRVVAAKDFTGSGSAADQVGHGTHVAGTVAGDGSADAGRVGMAPDADLLIGKVIGANGGSQSGIIDGMEWAVAAGADVINMSLGSTQPTVCDDPIADAVAELSDEALFVISAGNLSTRTSVSSPGCTEEALTVGAVDANGDVASFSSRGAVLGDHRVKPDISAPGVAIVSANAGSPGGVAYRAMSGTSMAAPHVAGAAALVAQAHPDWTPQEIKRALAASVKDDETSTVYEEGSGELWVPGAIDATITSDVSVTVGSFAWPHGKDQQASVQVGYENTGTEDVHLTLSVDDVEGADGARVPSSTIRVSPKSVVVPAGGSVEVTVEARGDKDQIDVDAFGEISARVLAKSGAETAVTTAVGLWLEPETVAVDFEVIDRNGEAATVGLLDVVDRHAPARSIRSLTGSVHSDELTVGTYSIGAYIRTTVDGQRTWTYVAMPETEITGSTTRITLDAREATQITVDTPLPMEVRDSQLGMFMTWDRWQVESYVATTGSELYVTPTDKVKDGEFGFAATMRGYEPGSRYDSPYVYNLAFVSEQKIVADQHHEVSERDLASVEESWHGELGQLLMLDTMTLTPEGWGLSLTGLSMPFSAPLERTAYYTPGVTWQQSASTFSRLPTALWVDPEREYAAGEETGIDWFKLRSRTGTAYAADGSPSRAAERQGTLIGWDFPHWQDTVAGREGIAGFREVGNSALWVDGEYRGSSAFPFAQADIGEGTHDIRVRIIQLLLGSAKLSTATFTTFSFESDQPEGDSVAALPLVFPRYDAEVDEMNRAPRDTAFPLTIGTVGQDGYDPGDWTELTVRMTTEKFNGAGGALPGDSVSWVEVPVEQRDGEWVALIDQSEVPANSTISIAVEGVDSHGSHVEQYVLDFYQVP